MFLLLMVHSFDSEFYFVLLFDDVGVRDIFDSLGGAC